MSWSVSLTHKLSQTEESGALLSRGNYEVLDPWARESCRLNMLKSCFLKPKTYLLIGKFHCSHLVHPETFGVLFVNLSILFTNRVLLKVERQRLLLPLLFCL